MPRAGRGAVRGAGKRAKSGAVNALKSKKETTRTLLPDAPPRKRSSKQSPDRVECRLVAGTPATPPAPKRQKRKTRMRSEDSDEPTTLCDWTTGGLKNEMSPSISKVARKERKGATDVSVEKWLISLVSDEDEDDDDFDINLDLGGDLGLGDNDFANDAPATLPDALNERLAEWLTTNDIDSDRHLSEMMSNDHKTFDWTGEHTTFTGQRETFKGTPGPTFPLDDDTRPIDIFLKYFDDDLIDLIVTKTNRHATYCIDSIKTKHSRLNYWKNTDKNEITTFLAILIYQGLVPLPVENQYWKENSYLTLKYFKNLMTFNRFVILKRVLHFSDSNLTARTIQTDSTDPKLRKIWPVLNHLQKKFSELYLPGQAISIDESLLKWKGRLSFKQRIENKAAKVGVKSYELCESSTGYLWNFYICTGRDEQQTTEQQNIEITAGFTAKHAPTDATARIVLKLVNPLLNLGHTLVMDNFYNSPLLARYLKSHGTDCYGTLRINRKFVPESIKSMSKDDMRIGEVVQTFCRDVSVYLWRDNNLVSLLSTYHGGEFGGKEGYGQYKYKPQIVLDYNYSMGNLEKKDQLLSAHPIERSRNSLWYKKIFRRLLNLTIFNSYIIYRGKHPKTCQRAFREQLAEELVRAFNPVELEQSVPTVVSNLRSPLVASAPGRITRPILTGNHFLGIGPTKFKRCVWCKQSRSTYLCKHCKVTLCLDICFEEYHTVPRSRS